MVRQPKKTPKVIPRDQNWRLTIRPSGACSLGALSYEGSIKPDSIPALSYKPKSHKWDKHYQAAVRELLKEELEVEYYNTHGHRREDRHWIDRSWDTIPEKLSQLTPGEREYAETLQGEELMSYLSSMGLGTGYFVYQEANFKAPPADPPDHLDPVNAKYRSVLGGKAYSHKQRCIRKYRGLAMRVIPAIQARIKQYRALHSVRRGMNGITRYGQDQIVSMATLFQRKYGKEHVGMGLCTIPSFSEEGLERIHRNWSKIVNTWRKAVLYQLKRLGLPEELCYVFEIQEGRFAKYDVPVLHIHYLMPIHLGIPFRDAWDHWMRRYWTKLMNKWAGEKSRYLAVGNLMPVEKDAAAYIGKYLSKGVKVIQKMCEKGYRGWVPSTWWGASKNMKEWVKDETIEVYGVGEELLDTLEKSINDEGDSDKIDWIGSHTSNDKYKTAITQGLSMSMDPDPRKRAWPAKYLKAFEDNVCDMVRAARFTLGPKYSGDNLINLLQAAAG